MATTGKRGRSSRDLLPTPRANRGGFPDSHGSMQAWDRLLLPTPTCNKSTYQRDRDGRVYPTLRGLASTGMLPTPLARDGESRGAMDPEQRRQDGHSPNLNDTICNGTGGSLHPRFVEWMIGLPQGWTDLDGDDGP